MHSCIRCGKMFKYKYLLARHNNNKKICNTDNKNLNILNCKIETINNDIFDI